MRRRAADAGRAEFWVDGGFVEEARVYIAFVACTSFADLTPLHIAAATPTTGPGVLSAGPLFRELTN